MNKFINSSIFLSIIQEQIFFYTKLQNSINLIFLLVMRLNSINEKKMIHYTLTLKVKASTLVNSAFTNFKSFLYVERPFNFK